MNKENVKEHLKKAEDKLTSTIDDSIREFVKETGLIPKINIEYLDASGPGGPVMLPMVTLTGLVPIESGPRVF